MRGSRAPKDSATGSDPPTRVALDGRVSPREPRFACRALAGLELAADGQRAVFFVAAVAAEDVFAFLEGQREAAGDALGEVLLLAEDRFAVEHLDLGHLRAAVVFDFEGDRAGRRGGVVRLAAGGGQL